jgi:hypothetical protein
MPLPLIVVEIPAQDRAAPEVPALLEACASGLGGGRCELTQPSNADPTSGIAIVSWRDPDHLSALVEVARVQDPGEGWRSEELRFKAQDRPVERFRTLGLAIATLFRQAARPPDKTQPSAAERPAPEPKQPAPGRAAAAKAKRPKPVPAKAEPETVEPPEPEPGDRKPDIAAPPHHALSWISAGGLAAYDPKLSDWHYGGLLKLSLGARAFPGFVSAFGSYATGPRLDEVSLDRATLGLGPGLRFSLSPSLELRAVLRGLMVNVSGRISERGTTSRKNAWLPGAALDLELALRGSGRVSGAVGAQVEEMAGNVSVREHDELNGIVGKTAVGVTLTLELRLLGEQDSESAH